MPDYMTINEFFLKYGKIPSHFFFDRFKNPFLLVSMSISRGVFSESPNPAKEKVKPKQLVDLKRDRDDIVTKVIQLEKPEPEKGGMVFSIGRASGNDIVLFHRRISKQHATLREDPASKDYSLCDAGSDHGTKINGKAIEKGKPFKVNDNSTLELGGAALCTFMTADTFHFFMNQLNKK
jgi:hypothetical protein